MKKTLLSVLAAGLVGAVVAPAALAADEFVPVAPGPNHFENNKFVDDNKENEFKLTDVTQKEVNDKLIEQSKAKTEKANKGKKVPTKKALPKTSAVK